MYPVLVISLWEGNQCPLPSLPTSPSVCLYLPFQLFRGPWAASLWQPSDSGHQRYCSVPRRPPLRALHRLLLQRDLPAEDAAEAAVGSRANCNVPCCVSTELRRAKRPFFSVSLRTSNTAFKEALKQIEGSSECGGLPMISFLILPMQRVTRLPLLQDVGLTSTVTHKYEAIRFPSRRMPGQSLHFNLGYIHITTFSSLSTQVFWLCIVV